MYTVNGTISGDVYCFSDIYVLMDEIFRLCDCLNCVKNRDFALKSVINFGRQSIVDVIALGIKFILE